MYFQNLDYSTLQVCYPKVSENELEISYIVLKRIVKGNQRLEFTLKQRDAKLSVLTGKLLLVIQSSV